MYKCSASNQRGDAAARPSVPMRIVFRTRITPAPPATPAAAHPPARRIGSDRREAQRQRVSAAARQRHFDRHRWGAEQRRPGQPALQARQRQQRRVLRSRAAGAGRTRQGSRRARRANLATSVGQYLKLAESIVGVSVLTRHRGCSRLNSGRKSGAVPTTFCIRRASCRHTGGRRQRPGELSGVRGRPMIVPMPTRSRPRQRCDPASASRPMHWGRDHRPEGRTPPVRKQQAVAVP